MTLNIDNTTLRSLIPNVIHEVDGEAKLYAKLLPWLETSHRWLAALTAYEDYALPEELLPLARKIVVNKAFAEAVPSLDIALSPAGFAVISTEGRVPASKERVERLIAALRTSVDANLEVLIAELRRHPDWRATKAGQYWCGTLLDGLRPAMETKGERTVADTYAAMRREAMEFEATVEEDYFGPEVMEYLREEQFAVRSSVEEIIGMVRKAELDYIARHLRQQKARCPDDHEVWHAVRGAMYRFRYHAELMDIWIHPVHNPHRHHFFKNDIKGAYYL